MQRPKAILVSASGHSTADHYPDLLDTLPSRYVQQQQSSLPVSPSPHQAGFNRVTKLGVREVLFTSAPSLLWQYHSSGVSKELYITVNKISPKTLLQFLMDKSNSSCLML